MAGYIFKTSTRTKAASTAIDIKVLSMVPLVAEVKPTSANYNNIIIIIII
jgi:hypothetical protein